MTSTGTTAPLTNDDSAEARNAITAAVQEYLRVTVQRLVQEWGYRYLKMDGLYTGAGVPQIYVNDAYKPDGMGDAVFHDPSKTNIEAYRDGLKLIRETAGRDVLSGTPDRPKRKRAPKKASRRTPASLRARRAPHSGSRKSRRSAFACSSWVRKPTWRPSRP